MATAERILASIGIDTPVSVLAPLARGTVENAEEGGGAAATLTGPVVRGDVRTVELHVSDLRRRDPELAEAYIRASLSILYTAVKVGRVDVRTAAAMKALLR
jgi:predicted short-subunit dehydrogenase-like oxidoreductase (DUF2520 family)